MKPEIIAEICHEANRIYCESIGDNSQVAWQFAPNWQRDSALDGVQKLIAAPHAAPWDSHNNWMKHKEADGWTYGPVKDAEKKTHPCMVPFRELPAEQQKKDFIFYRIVRALADA